MDPQRQLLCLLLHTQPRLGMQTTETLLQRFSSAESFWAAPRSSLAVDASPAANAALLELWRSAGAGDPWRRALHWQQHMQEQGILLLGPADDEYPALLRDIPDRPGALYLRGDPTVLVLPHLAVVGSRSAGRAGLELATDFARELAAGGLAICSGLALGIDGAAHRGALAAGGRTLAVLGTGVDRVYPRQHHALAGDIMQRGALLSEYPPGTAPLPRHFPRRNRIIAGISLGTLVVEAAARSGSLITARLALDYNREVFAVPGSVHNPNCKGSHRLIRQGAKLVETAGHIVEELDGWLQLMAAESGSPRCGSPGRGSPGEGRGAPESHLADLLAAIDYAPTSLDKIAARMGAPGHQLAGDLLELELGRWIECSAGAYQRCR